MLNIDTKNAVRGLAFANYAMRVMTDKLENINSLQEVDISTLHAIIGSCMVAFEEYCEDCE